MIRFADGIVCAARLVLLTSLLGVTIASCKKDEIVDPPPPKDPRTYTWTIDTLAYPASFQTLMLDVWGSSSTDVYAVGHNDRAGKGNMYHYDGHSWQPVLLNVNEGGQIVGAFDLSGIHGFSASDIWAAGNKLYINHNPPPNVFDSTVIIHFDGSVWREVPTVRNKRYLQFIAGTTPQSLWIGGGNGSCYRWNAGRMEQVILPITFSSDYEWRVSPVQIGNDLFCYVDALSLSTGASKCYMAAQKPIGSSWAIQDSFVVDGTQTSDPKWGMEMVFSPYGELYSLRWLVHKWNGVSWDVFFQSSGSPPTGMIITISGRKYVATLYKLYLLDGDTYEFSNPLDQNWAFYDVWANDTDVFVLAQDGRKTIVLHGK